MDPGSLKVKVPAEPQPLLPPLEPGMVLLWLKIEEKTWVGAGHEGHNWGQAETLGCTVA